MRWHSAYSRVLRAVIAVGMTVVLSVMLFNRDRQEAEERLAESREVTSNSWKISELVFESQRLSDTLIAHGMGEVGQADVALAFDLLWSRVDVLAATSIVSDASIADNVAAYRSFLETEEGLILGASPLSQEDIGRLRSALAGLAREARVLWVDGFTNPASYFYVSGAAAIQGRGDKDGRRLFVIFLIGLNVTYVIAEIYFSGLAQQREARLRQIAAAASAAKSQFLANVSHEIRTPLNGILSMATELAETQLSRDQRACVSVIEQSGGILLSTLNDVLDLSKVEAGKLEVLCAPFDLHAVLEASHQLYAAVAREKGIVLTLDVAPEVPRAIVGDGRRLRQVLHNLIANAVKFTEEGAVSIKASVSDASDRLVIAVNDSGPGLTPEQQSRIFQPFSQVDNISTRAVDGTGLGLSISHQLCTAMGGSLSVQSDPGQGATFLCDLPLFAAELPRKEHADATAAEPLKLDGQHILVVDDNKTNRLILSRYLAPTGCTMHLAQTGREAVDLSGSLVLDAILMDVQMPEMDGITATRLIREREGNSGSPPVHIVAVTANVMSHQVEEYRAAGFDDVLPKPVSKRVLMQLLGNRSGDADARLAS